MAKLMRAVGGCLDAGPYEVMSNQRTNSLRTQQALARKKTRRLLLGGRPYRKYAAIEAPTSAGKGRVLR